MQIVVFEAYLSTKKEDKPMFVKVPFLVHSRSLSLNPLVCQGSLLVATVGGAVLLAAMAVFGYAAFGQDCESDILSNFSVDYTATRRHRSLSSLLYCI